MGFRSGNDYRVAIGLETSLGSGKTHASGGGSPVLSIRWDDLTVMPATLVLAPDRQMIETGYKTGTAQPVAQERCQGVTDGTFTLSGVLSLDYMILLASMFGEKYTGGNKTYKFKDKPLEPISMVMMKIWPDVNTPSTNFTTDIAMGCTPDELVITGTSKEAVRFTMTGRITDHEQEIVVAITGTDPGIVFPEYCLQMKEVLYDGKYGETNRLHAFTITLRNLYAKDEYRYANAAQRTKDLIERQEATLNIRSIYNQEPTEKNPMNTRGLVDIDNAEKIILSDGDIEWKFELYVALDSLDPADPGRDKLETNATLNAAIGLLGDNALTITITEY